MSVWQNIERGGKIDSKTSCVIVRKRKHSRNGWNVSIAYRDVSGVWRLDRASWPTVEAEEFAQWCEIPL